MSLVLDVLRGVLPERAGTSFAFVTTMWAPEGIDSSPPAHWFVGYAIWDAVFLVLVIDHAPPVVHRSFHGQPFDNA